MSTYQELKGLKIKYLSSDTSGDRIKEGEVFYNSKDFNLKAFVATAAWNSSSSLGTARYKLASAPGAPATAGIVFSGQKAGSGADHVTNLTEEYTGTGFSVGGNLNTSRRGANGFGTQTTAVCVGGFDGGPAELADVEEYNGSTWTEVNNTPNTRRLGAGCGTLTAGITFGGLSNGSDTFEYDGTNWTSGGSLNTGRRELAGFGTQTAALGAGGYATNASVEEYNGTSWTEVNNIGTGRYGAGGGGLQTDGLIFGGHDGSVTGKTETYDGTTFTETSDMATSRTNVGGFGASKSSAVAAGGGAPPGRQSATEEFTISLSATTAGAWASGNAASTARNNPGSAGTKTAGMIISGSVNDTELYNGTSFSEGPDVNVHAEQHFSTGTQTAALKAGGSGGNQTEEYNGSSFSNVPGALTNYPRNAGGSAGTQTAAVMFGGNNPPGPVNAVSHTEEYNGTSFSEVNNMSQARFGMNSGMGGGTQTAAIAVGGFVSNPPLVISDKSEEYDGTNWSSGGDLLTPTQKPGMGGTQTALMVAGSELPSVTSFCQTYDGSSFATAPSMGNVQAGGASAGSSTSMWHAVGGDGTANLSINQEFTGESTAARAVKTVDFD